VVHYQIGLHWSHLFLDLLYLCTDLWKHLHGCIKPVLDVIPVPFVELSELLDLSWSCDCGKQLWSEVVLFDVLNLWLVKSSSMGFDLVHSLSLLDEAYRRLLLFILEVGVLGHQLKLQLHELRLLVLRDLWNQILLLSTEVSFQLIGHRLGLVKNRRVNLSSDTHLSDCRRWLLIHGGQSLIQGTLLFLLERKDCLGC